MGNVSENFFRENQNTFNVKHIFFFGNRAAYEIMWKNPNNKNQLDALFIPNLFRQSPLHVSGMLLPIIRRYQHIHTITGTCYTFSHSLLAGSDPVSRH
jgi:hypothetical protein